MFIDDLFLIVVILIFILHFLCILFSFNVYCLLIFLLSSLELLFYLVIASGLLAQFINCTIMVF